MAFCAKCGAQMEDNVAFCPACGASTATEETPNVQNEAVAPVANEQKKPFPTKLVAIIGGAAAALILLVVILVVALGGGYKKPVKTLLSAYKKGENNYEVYAKTMPKAMYKAYFDGLDLLFTLDDQYQKDFEKDSARYYEDEFDGLEEHYGKYKLSFEVKDYDELKKSEIKEIVSYYEDYAEAVKDYTDADDLMDLVDEAMEYDDFEDEYEDVLTEKNVKKIAKYFEGIYKEFKDVEISKAYIVEVDVEIEGEDDDWDYTYEIYVAKLNGSWGIVSDHVYDIAGSYASGYWLESRLEDIMWDITYYGED
ncbi:MAG: zinc-ribbon domain-containing protein [Lachnospiraceae bacterium]|nr:zinc-ribbon domain-containing protein [Lachnospiraceae bacterium]